MIPAQELTAAEERNRLRESAETLIHEGGVDSSKVIGTLGIDALELLYRRASNPEFAADALKLLHELQTHQVELDLLHEEMQATINELTNALNHYKTVYDHAPVPYLILDISGRIIESNQLANKWLSLCTKQTTDQHLNDLLASSSRTTVKEMIDTLRTSPATASCVAKLCSDLGDDSRVTLEARREPNEDWIFMTLSPGPTTTGN